MRADREALKMHLLSTGLSDQQIIQVLINALELNHRIFAFVKAMGIEEFARKFKAADTSDRLHDSYSIEDHVKMIDAVREEIG